MKLEQGQVLKEVAILVVPRQLQMKDVEVGPLG